MSISANFTNTDRSFTFDNISVEQTNGTYYEGSPNSLTINSSGNNTYSTVYTYNKDGVTTEVNNELTYTSNPSTFTWSGDNLYYSQQTFFLDFFFGMYTILSQTLSNNPNIDYLTLGTVFTCPVLTSNQLYST